MTDNEEFNLSKKIVLTSERSCFMALDVTDVKEFIRLLKKELAEEQEGWTNGWGATLVSDTIINKLAGSSLINGDGSK